MTPHLSIQVVRQTSELKQHIGTWSDLVRRAVEPNVFYEPAFFLAAIETLSDLSRPLVVLIYARAETGGEATEELVAFIPFGKVGGRPFERIIRFELYHHLYSYLCTPLIDSRYLKSVVETLLDWIATSPDGIAVFDLPIMDESGPVWQAIHEGLESKGLPHFPLPKVERALFRRQESAEAFLSRALSAKKRKELRRQRRRLEELGKLELRIIGPEDSIESWAEQFIRIEASGWKKTSRHAFAFDPEQSVYFKRLLRDGMANRTLLMLALTLDGMPIALKCSFRSAGQPRTGFAFKIAYDERYARYSPGVQLEIESIRYLHEIRPEIDWMDSCALPDHSMIDPLWRDRRAIAGFVCSGPDMLSRGLLLLRKVLED